MKNDIEAKRPQGMTWNDTKVMPFYAGEDLPDDRDILIISDKTGYAVKSGELPREWKEVEGCKEDLPSLNEFILNQKEIFYNAP